MATEPVILITGAATGIGAAIARRVAVPGAGMVLHTGRNAEGLAQVADEARASGAEVVTCLGNLGDPETVKNLIGTAHKTFGRIDQIVSNAGSAHRSRFGDLTAEELDRAFSAMPMAFFRILDAALPDLRSSEQGRVVAISSFVAHAYGTNGLLFPASSAAKAALEALAKTAAVQLAPDGVTVNCIAPGFVRKDAGGHRATSSETMDKARMITPNGRLGEPADIAEMAAFLLSPASAHLTGQILHVDGGLLLP